MSDGTPAIVTERLSKWYGYVMGLNEVSVQIRTGVTALLGPNGAGKSTFMKLATGQLRPNQGRITVLGVNPWNRPAVLQRIGYCSERDAMFAGLTGRKFVEWTCRLRGLSAREASARAEESLARLGLADALDRSVGGYSKGMRQRVRLAAVDALDLDLYILDEPTTGTDPVVRDQIVRWIRALGQAGKTVLVSSHNLPEVEQMTERLILILGGRVRAAGDKAEIQALLETGVVELQIQCGDPRALSLALMERSDVHGAVITGADRLTLTAEPTGDLYEALPGLAARKGGGLVQLVAPETSLGELFREMTRRRRGGR